MTVKKRVAKAADTWLTVDAMEGVLVGWSMAAGFVVFLLYLVGRALYLAWH